jgi:hypothetical protein
MDNFDDIFNLKPYILEPTTVGQKSFDLVTFLYDVRDLPKYQATEFSKRIIDDETAEHFGQTFYTTKEISENFFIVTPILLYRIVEKSFKKYLGYLYESNPDTTYPAKIDKANFEVIKRLYLDSTATLNIETIECYSIINEIRELNNCLKHSEEEFISDKLNAINNFWIVDEKITIEKIQERIADYSWGIGKFFHVLVNHINPFIS